MKFLRFGKWLLTEKGRTFLFYAAGTTTTGIMLAHFVPNTFLLDQYLNIIQYYKYAFWAILSIE